MSIYDTPEMRELMEQVSLADERETYTKQFEAYSTRLSYTGSSYLWKPLEDAKDSMELAARHRVSINFKEDCLVTSMPLRDGTTFTLSEPLAEDAHYFDITKAIRLSIVRTVAYKAQNTRS